MEAESGADRHHFLLQAFTSNGKNRQREKLHGGGVTAKSAAEAQLGEAAAGEAGGQSSPPASTVSVSLSSMVPFVMSHRASGSKLHCQIDGWVWCRTCFLRQVPPSMMVNGLNEWVKKFKGWMCLQTGKIIIGIIIIFASIFLLESLGSDTVAEM